MVLLLENAKLNNFIIVDVSAINAKAKQNLSYFYYHAKPLNQAIITTENLIKSQFTLMRGHYLSRLLDLPSPPTPTAWFINYVSEAGLGAIPTKVFIPKNLPRDRVTT